MAEGLAADDAIEKARRIAPLQRIRQALRRLWQALRNLLGLSRWSSPEALADDLLSDLLNRVNPLARANAKQKVGGRASLPDQSRVANRTADPMEIARRMDERNGTEVGRFVDFLRRGKLREGESRYFHIGETGATLNRYGISGKITISSSVGNSHHSRDNDHLNEGDWIRVFQNINDPIAITRYPGRNSYRIYTYVEKNGKNICVGVDVNSIGRDVNITNIKTAFARDIANALDESLVYPNSRQELETAIRERSLHHNHEVYPGQPYDAAKVGNNSESSNNPDDFLPDDIRFQFAGEKGAAAMDAAEEATTRLDNLAVARQMETAGREPLAIKLATGWERGKDGLWRYEIPDGNSSLFAQLKDHSAAIADAFFAKFNAENKLNDFLDEYYEDEIEDSPKLSRKYERLEKKLSDAQ